MIKNQFKDQEDFKVYIEEQKIRMKRGFLTCSEREILKKMLEKNYKPTFIKEKKSKLPIVTYIIELRKPCQLVTKEDNIKEIIQKLKDTLDCYEGYGISANQIGIQKKISYVKIPRITKDKKLEFTELILINPEIIEKSRPTKINNEGCLSFPGISVTTKRYVFITIKYLNENLKEQIFMSQDLDSFVIQHEIEHTNGITIFDRKYKK